MSMLDSLVAAGALARWRLDGGVPERRAFYYTVDWERFFNALPREMERLPPQRRRVPMQAQVAALVGAFVRGDSRARLAVAGMLPPFAPMRPARLRVWELRTPDTRGFGWFAAPDRFVAVGGERTQVLKAQPSLYAVARDRVDRWRHEHRIRGRDIADAADWAELVGEPSV